MKSNQKIFITGASSGIGEAIAYEYASQGAVLGLAARRSEKLETVKTKCMELGAKDVKNYSLDVSNTKESMSVAKDFVGFDKEGIDIVVANAGVAASDNLSSGDPTKINQNLIINIIGLTNSIVPFVPTMKSQKDGNIVIMSSIASFTAPAYFGGYAASKVAVRRLGDTWRTTLKKHNVKEDDCQAGKKQYVYI